MTAKSAKTSKKSVANSKEKTETKLKVVKSSRKTDLELQVDKHAKAKELAFVTMKLTPADAEYILEENKINRSLNPYLVNRYVETMKQPKHWVLNGECIKISKSGRLLDGQHRLHAVFKAGQSIPMTVCFGLNEKTFMTLDTGRPRSAGDVLHIAGYSNWNFLAAAMRYMLYYQRDESFPFNTYWLNPSDILEAVQRWPEFEKTINPAYRVKHVFATSMAAFFMYITKSIDENMAWDFFLKIETGEELKKRDAILQFRELMMKYRAQRLMPDKRHVLANLIETWNAYYYGEPGTNIKWHTGKPFPEIAGVNRKKLFKDQTKK